MAKSRKTANRNKAISPSDRAPRNGKQGMSSSFANGPTPDVFTLKEAAEYLRVPERDVLRLIQEQGLPARNVGTDWRLLRNAIHEWLGARAPAAEARKAAQLALAGKYKNDPDLIRICEEAYRQRGELVAEDE
jgi:excisionase family DNA binding protein